MGTEVLSNAYKKAKQPAKLNHSFEGSQPSREADQLDHFICKD
jgi:hypothetical protein